VPTTIDLVCLAAGELRAAIAPQAGGSIASFSRAWRESGKQRELHWLRPATAQGLADRNPLEMASFPLVPFCNRIRNGRASFEGRDIRMPPNNPAQDSPHPLHGIGWLRPWELVSSSDTQATLALDVPASAAWPWHFSARQQYTLTPAGLHVAMALRNDDTVAMPAGIGHHPYFPHHPGTRITSPTGAMWTTDAQVMPVALRDTPAVRQLRDGVEVSRLELDNNFTGWQRRTLVEWPADVHGPARTLTMTADAPLDFFVLYCPRGYEYFCAEPVSQCTDWLNLADAYGREAIGGARIEPGDELSAQFTLRPGA
jgi:aldose 1-epimerase